WPCIFRFPSLKNPQWPSQPPPPSPHTYGEKSSMKVAAEQFALSLAGRRRDNQDFQTPVGGAKELDNEDRLRCLAHSNDAATHLAAVSGSRINGRQHGSSGYIPTA